MGNQQQRPQPNILGSPMMVPGAPMMVGPGYMQPMPGVQYGQNFVGTRQARSNSGSFAATRQARANSGSFQGNVQMQRGRSNSGQGFRAPAAQMGAFGPPAGRGFAYPAPMYGYSTTICFSSRIC